MPQTMQISINGVEYRVYDVDGTNEYANPPRHWAVGRVFRSADGNEWLFRFPKDTTRPSELQLDEVTLRRQRAESMWYRLSTSEPKAVDIPPAG